MFYSLATCFEFSTLLFKLLLSQLAHKKNFHNKHNRICLAEDDNFGVFHDINTLLSHDIVLVTIGCCWYETIRK